jgi:hypothetical protein
MKPALTFLALSMLLISCSGLGGGRSNMVTGAWNYDDALKMAISPDGRFSMITLGPNSRHPVSFAGTWQLRGETFTLTFISTPGMNGQPTAGGVEPCRIILLNDRYFIYEEKSDGTVHKLTRMPPNNSLQATATVPSVSTNK